MTFPLLLSVAYVSLHLGSHPDRVRIGDWALTELFTWHAARGTLAEGVCSSYGFQFLGPLQFYCMAPFYALSGGNVDAIFVAVLLLNLAAVLTLLWVVWRCAGLATMVSLGVVLSYYHWFTGMALISSPWAVYLAETPFLTAVALFAAVATGRLAYLPAALLAGSFVVQTHLAFAPALAVVMVFSLALWAAPQGVRTKLGIRQPRSGRLFRALLLSLIILVPVWLPTVIRETTLPTKSIGLMMQRLGAPAQYSWGESLPRWAQALAAFPYFCASGERRPTDADRPAENKTPADTVLVVVQVAMLAAAYSLARRNRQDFHCVMSLLCGLLLLALLASVRCIKAGGDYPHATSWMSSASLFLISTYLASLGRWLRGRLSPGTELRWRRVLGGAIVAALTVACLHNSTECLWQLRGDLAIEDQRDRAVWSLAHAAGDVLRREHAERCLVCMIDSRLWPEAAGLVVQLTKAGFSPAVEQRWWRFFGAHHAHGQGAEGRLFLANVAWADRVRYRPGVELVAESPTQKIALLWQASRSAATGSYLFSELPLFTSEYDGFSPCEGEGDNSFCWSDGPRSRLVVSLAAGRGYCMTVRAASILLFGQTQVMMTVLLNGQVVGEVRFDPPIMTDHAFALPAAYVRDRNEIIFSYTCTVCPMREGLSPDRRELGIQFSRLTFAEDEGNTPSR